MMKYRVFRRITRASALLISLILLLSGCGKKRDGEIGEGPYSCTLSVECGNLLSHLSDLDPEKAELVPADGIILPPTTVHFSEGESAFDVLLKAALHDRIHLEYSESPLYHSMYIEGINNLYEFDAGALSGWMYSVNGEFPGFGASSYRLSDGDTVRFLFTCDLGEDLGNPYAE